MKGTFFELEEPSGNDISTVKILWPKALIEDAQTYFCFNEIQYSYIDNTHVKHQTIFYILKNAVSTKFFAYYIKYSSLAAPKEKK